MYNIKHSFSFTLWSLIVDTRDSNFGSSILSLFIFLHISSERNLHFKIGTIFSLSSSNFDRIFLCKLILLFRIPHVTTWFADNCTSISDYQIKLHLLFIPVKAEIEKPTRLFKQLWTAKDPKEEIISSYYIIFILQNEELVCNK